MSGFLFLKILSYICINYSGVLIGEPERQHPTPQGQRGIQIETDRQQINLFFTLTE